MAASEFSAPPARASFHGLLFDMDGTIIDSTSAVIKHYQIIGEQIGVDADAILEVAHGRRTIDVIRMFKPDRANWEYVKSLEADLPKKYGSEAHEIPGAKDLLNQAMTRSVPWAIVTSGTTGLVTGWLKVLGLPVPKHLVVAEDVEQGKPDPAGYIKGRKSLGLETEDKNVLVFEDSPAGIMAGKAAGCKVVGVVTSHNAEQIKLAEPDWIVKDLSSVVIVGMEDDTVVLEFRDGLVKAELAS
ncbi:glycerol 3-phosphatase 1 [[Emmonsia] crescens]|uniref:Glycerol 3-phosphatase 1 n=1 Tax=[Emmonsia] crescens TaxID=73230 RepID=A0A0G2ID35_9EURO|nr:glycerol 3-phosphatase 1 [Emmonsia crescens UAMH 3008]